MANLYLWGVVVFVFAVAAVCVGLILSIAKLFF